MLVPYLSGLLLSIIVLLDFQYVAIVGHSTWDMESTRNLHVEIVDLHWGLYKREYKIKLLGMPSLNDCHSQKQIDCWPRQDWGIPRRCLVTGPRNDNGDASDMCTVALELAKQMELGDQSQFALFMNYLQDTQWPAQLPSYWSPSGKRLLMSLLTNNGRQLLPPNKYLENWYAQMCGREYIDTIGLAYQLVC